MAESKIEWTERTWNPIVGCSIVSPGCTNCYAMKMAARLETMGNVSHYAGTTRKVNGNAVWTGKIAYAPENILAEPLKRRTPTTYFVNSMGDLFHESIPDEAITQVFAIMGMAKQHTFQVLTKRAERMRQFTTALYARRSKTVRELMASFDPVAANGRVPSFVDDPLPNVWLGVSAERQQEADERIPLLLQTPAAIRFISAEPLLGPIDFGSIAAGRNPDGSGQYATPLYGGVTHRSANGYAGDPSCCRDNSPIYLREIQETPKLDWVIVGGESGPNARPMHPDWARSLRDQCAAARVPMFFKQWGAFAPSRVISNGWFDDNESVLNRRAKTAALILPGPLPNTSTLVERVGKKAAGRLLDGKLHNAMPQRVTE